MNESPDKKQNELAQRLLKNKKLTNMTIQLPDILSEGSINESPMTVQMTEKTVTMKNFTNRRNTISQIPQSKHSMGQTMKDNVNKILDELSVNIDTSMCKMAFNDGDIIDTMKQKIDYYQSAAEKREKLMLAIINNVQYLQQIHAKNK